MWLAPSLTSIPARLRHYGHTLEYAWTRLIVEIPDGLYMGFAHSTTRDRGNSAIPHT